MLHVVHGDLPGSPAEQPLAFGAVQSQGLLVGVHERAVPQGEEHRIARSAEHRSEPFVCPHHPFPQPEVLERHGRDRGDAVEIPSVDVELGERAIEVGGHATDHVLPDADRHDGIGRDAGLARRVDLPGGDDPWFQGAEIRALARTPAQERGTEVGSMRAEPPLDRWSDGDEAGWFEGDAVGCQEGVDRPGRPERLVDEPTRSVDQLLERADRRAGAGQLVDLARSIRARARGVVAPDDLLGEPGVLETAGDGGRRELGQGFGGERYVFSAPRQTEDADQRVLAMQPDEEQRADPGVDQLAPGDRVER